MSTRMWSVFKKYLPAKLFKLTYLQRSFVNGRLKSTENPWGALFPWTPIEKDDWKASPFFHKLMGLFIMKKILQSVNAPFKNHEFLQGVQFAINAVSEAIATQDIRSLQQMMGAQLAQCFRSAFLTMSERHQSVCLELEKTKLLRITGIRSIFGKADPSDKHILKVCGQEIVGSKRKLESVIQESESPWNDSKAIGETAAKLGVTFQVNVTFRSHERFYIESGSRTIAGSKELRTCYHIWQFETHVDWITWDKNSEQSYPIAWEITDMNQFIDRNFPTHDSFDIVV